MNRYDDELEFKQKFYDENGNEAAAVSTLQAQHEWCLQYKQTLLAQRIAFVEGLAILALIALFVAERIV